MTASKIPPLHVLRGILRRLKVPKSDSNAVGDSSSSSNNATRTYIMKQYRTSRSVASPQQVGELRQMAFDYYTLKQDLAERSRLHGIDTGVENQLSAQEMSRRSAARAGLLLPQLDPDLK
jgi:hypothetical protein